MAKKKKSNREWELHEVTAPHELDKDALKKLIAKVPALSTWKVMMMCVCVPSVSMCRPALAGQNVRPVRITDSRDHGNPMPDSGVAGFVLAQTEAEPEPDGDEPCLQRAG